MVHKGRIIILNTTKTGENSLVVHALSRGEGRRSFICSVGKKSGMALFLPLNILDCEIIDSGRSELRRLRSITVLSPLNSLRADIYKNAIAMFVSEVLYRSVHEGGFEDGMFDWVERTVMTLEALEGDFSNFHLRFLLELCVQMGFSPAIEDIAPFAEGCLADVKALLTAPFARFMLVPLSGARRSAVASALVAYLGYHTECRLEIRSLKVLGEIFV